MAANSFIYDKYLTSEKGLTSTAANYIANIAKEYIVELETKLSNIVCYNTYMELISSNNPILVEHGISDENITAFETILKSIANIKAFSAWLREGIKAKEAMIAEVKRTYIQAYLKNKYNIDASDFTGATLKKYTPAEYDRSVNEQAKYLELETYAAVFGKFIHNDGAFNIARKKFYEIQSKPHKIEGDGQDRIITNFRPSVNAEVLDSVYMQLQHEWRKYESELNKLKYDTEQENNKRDLEVNAENAKKLHEYKEYMQEYNTWQTEEINRISNLKIYIPENFKETYKFLETLGEKE